MVTSKIKKMIKKTNPKIVKNSVKKTVKTAVVKLKKSATNIKKQINLKPLTSHVSIQKPQTDIFSQKELIFTLRNIKIHFGIGKKRNKVINDVSLDTYSNICLAIVGESGSGKTTIGKGIMGINPIVAGQIYFKHQLIHGKRFNLAYCFKQLTNNIKNIEIIGIYLRSALIALNKTLTKQYYLYNLEQNDYEFKPFAKVCDLLNNVGKRYRILVFKYRKFNKIYDQIDTFKSDLIDLKDYLITKTTTLQNSIEKDQLPIKQVQKNNAILLNDKKCIEYLKLIDLDKIMQVINEIIKIDLESDFLSQNALTNQLLAFIADKNKKITKQFFVDINELIAKLFKIHKKLLKNFVQIKNALNPQINKHFFINNDQHIKKISYLNLLSAKKYHEYKQKIQMVFQDPTTSLNDRMSVSSIVAEGLNNYPNLYNDPSIKKQYIDYANSLQPNGFKLDLNSQIKKRDIINFMVLNILKKVGLLQEHMCRYIHEFSGGQKQRIGIARAMILKPDYIIADEPISALDVSIRAQILNLLSQFQKEYGLGYIFIAHDLSIVRAIADRVAVIYRGKFMEIADVNELYNNPLHPYTKSLFSAIPLPSPQLEKNKKLFVYEPEKEHYDYLQDPPSLQLIGKNHYVYCNKREAKAYLAKSKEA
jgi:oligopeptide transport system ATP-binding protein